MALMITWKLNISPWLGYNMANFRNFVGWVTGDPRVATVNLVTAAWVREPTLQAELVEKVGLTGTTRTV